MRVLLLNPPGRELYVRDYFCSKTTKSNYHFHPVDLLALSGTVAAEHDVSVLDCIAEGLSLRAAHARIDALKPAAIISLVGSVSWEEDREFLRLQASRGRRVFAIGDVLHADAEERLREEPWLEVILDDFTTADAAHLLSGREGEVQRSTWRRDDGAVVQRDEPRHGREHRLPRPLHELFPSSGYRFSFARRAPFATVLTDYGCPWSCTFCVISTLGHSTRPVEDVLEEVDALIAGGTRELFVADQTFGVSRDRALELCRAFRERDLSWTAFTRPDLADDELLQAMRGAGCHTLIMGVESADDEVSPIWSKSGSWITFVSNRTGGPQIYVVRPDGTGLRRVSMAGEYNTSPEFGKGGRIVFSGMDEFVYDIFTTDLSGSMTRVTQQQGSNRDPAWSPDGRYIVFVTTRNRKTQLFVATEDGRWQHELFSAPGHYSTPIWYR